MKIVQTLISSARIAPHNFVNIETLFLIIIHRILDILLQNLLLSMVHTALHFGDNIVDSLGDLLPPPGGQPLLDIQRPPPPGERLQPGLVSHHWRQYRLPAHPDTRDIARADLIRITPTFFLALQFSQHFKDLVILGPR